MTRIVVGIDGSENSDQALRWALAEARLRGAVLEAVHAWAMPIYVVSGFAPVVPPDRLAMHEAANELLEKAVARVLGDAKDVEVERDVIEGMAVRVLLGEAADADLLVVGACGHGGVAGILLGSVSRQCVQHALCPVVIVRHQRATA
jgi:nucleotide-binding universal stress UspA family protein